MNDRNIFDLNVFSAIGYLCALFPKKYAETKYRKCRKSVIDVAIKLSYFIIEENKFNFANPLLILSPLFRENL